ncbi:hypothetical protein EYS14_08050 [Alteromonadaceae bacterium M269]|nr:hypothetical protein EYS14_08050 [Alteromonadaceae bacterium M269]
MENIHLFNVTTTGSSASVWLNSLLNELGAVSFHALRSDPFSSFAQELNRADTPQLNQTELFRGLRMLGYAKTSNPPPWEQHEQRHQLAIGVVHTFYKSSEVKVAFNDIGGGRNIAMFRNPIHRINSQFQASYKAMIGKKWKSLFAELLNDYDNRFYPAFEQLISLQPEAKVNAVKIFDIFVNRIIECDIDNQKVCDESESLYYERMFTNVDETIKKLGILINRSISQVPLDAFKTKTNQHITKKSNVLESWQELPEILRDRLSKISVPREEYITCYKELGYDIETLGF